MKRFYLFALSCLVLTVARAQVSVPRPVASGVNFSAGAAKPALPRAAKPGSRIPAAERLRRNVPQKAVALSVEVDTTLCTGYTKTISGELLESKTVSYDKYGLRQLVTTPGPDGDRHERYTYEVNADAFWTKRTIETDYCPDGMEPAEGRVWYVNSTVQREMDVDGRVHSIVIDDSCARMYERSVYDYGHVYSDWDGTPRRGYQVEREYRRDGETQKEVYRWYEPAKAYLRASEEASYSRATAEFFADSVRTTSLYYNWDTGQWEVSEVVTDYYRMNGYPCEGRKTVSSYGGTEGSLAITIEAGDSVTTIDQNYDPATGQWVNYLKCVSSGKMWDPLYYSKYYWFIDGEWALSRTERLELVSSFPKAKLYKGYYGAVVYYAWFEGAESPVMLNRVDDETYVGTESEYDVTTYTYYDNECNVKGAYRVKESIDTPFGEQSGNNSEMDLYTVWVQQPDGTWKQSDSFEYTQMGYTVRHTFNAQGYPEKIIIFQSDPDNPIEEQRYTYGDKGYVVEYYERGVLRSRETFELMDDGWVSDITRRYNNEGTVTRGTRYDTWQNCSRTYTWDKESDTFTFDQVYAGDYDYTLEDGTGVSISYEADGGQVVPVTKRENYYFTRDDGEFTESRSADYYWNPVAGEWVGENCEYRFRSFYEFRIDYGRSDLIDSYDDGNDGYGDNISYDRDSRVVADGSIAYAWDEAAKSWTESERNGDFVTAMDDNSITVVSYGYGGDEAVTRVYERNAEGRIAKETETKTFVDGREPETSATVYTYTPEGYLLTKEETDIFQTTIIEAYTYERRTITITGIDDAHPAATATLAIEGLAVSAPGHIIRLFNVQGAEVAVGEGSVSAPRAGLYIVKVGDASVKVVLK